MSDATCSACGLTAPIRSLFDLNGQTFCGKCVKTASQEARLSGQPSLYMPLISRAICARCNTFIGESSSAVQIGGARFCAPCSTLIKDWDYPVWLKISLASLLVLLAVALFHSRKYFHAGRQIYIGERLIDEGKYADALPHLQETLSVAPLSDKASLLAAKAAILSGNPESAAKAFHDHNDGHYDDGNDARFLEVNGLWERATQGMDRVAEAQKLEGQDGHAAESAKLMHEAASLYPQLPGVSSAAEALDGAAAFERADYDGFLKFSEKLWKRDASSQSGAQLASALACKFAVTGDPSFRRQSEEMIQKARDLAKNDADGQKSLDEYIPRIQYRLNSRKIISKTEYDRRFGNPAGYVIHQQSENFTAQFFVSMGPFFANTLLCITFCSAAFLPVWELKVSDPLAYFFYWLGLSIGMHAFPSTQDLSHLWEKAPAEAKRGNLLAILSLPLAGILVIANYARVVWADLGYGILVGVLGPIAIFKFLAR